MSVDAKRVQAVFLAAVDVADAAQRAAILDRECAADAELRQRVAALLKAHDAPASILERPAATPLGAVPAPPDHTLPLEDSVGQAFQPDCQAGKPDLRGLSFEKPKQNPVTTAEGPTGDEDSLALEFLQPSTKPGSLGRLAHYEVLEVLGQGGFGVVVRAFDEKLQRVVAIKVLSAQLAATSPARKRFLREARASAKVRQEHVVQIYAVEEQPIPHLVMEYIPGRTLQQKLDDTGPLEVPEMLRLAVQIARGLAAAHAQGLIHRDVKPANILLEEAIEAHAKITDFGLARAADDASLTQSGVVAGTPMYMAPEQAEGKSIDQRADLFSLGSVFYVMLCGRPPFRASGTMAVLKRVCEDMPRPIREIIPEVPQWLCDVIGKLHAKKPDERFQTAAEVADLLSQHLAHLQQPQLVPQPAAPPSSPGRGTTKEPAVQAIKQAPARRRWRRALAAAVVLFAVGVGTAYYLMRPPIEPPKLLVEGTDKYFDKLKREDIPLALLAMAGGGDPEQAPRELVGVLGESRFVVPGPGNTNSMMVQSLDGKILAVGRGPNVFLFDAQSGKLLRSFPTGYSRQVYGLAFSPKGERLVGTPIHEEDGEGAKTIRVWNVLTGQQVHALTGHTARVVRAVFNHDGTKIVSGGYDKTVRVWDADTGKEIVCLQGHTNIIHHVNFSPDGEWVVSGDTGGPQIGNAGPGVVKVWDLKTEKEIRTLHGHSQPVYPLEFSPDRKLLATGSNAEIILWNAKTLEEVRTIRTSTYLLGFTADNRMLLTLGPGNVVTPWEVATGKPLETQSFKILGGEHPYCLSPDGKTLFASGNGGSVVRAYDAETGKELFPQQGHKSAVYSVAVSPDGRTIASGGADHTVRLWDLAGWKAGDALPPVRVLDQLHTEEVWSVVFSPDGKILASGSIDSTIVLWDVASGKEIRTLTGHSKRPSILAFSPDGKTIAAGKEDGSVNLWDVASGNPKIPLRWHQDAVRAVAFSPDGSLLASAGGDRTVQVVNLSTGRRVHSFRAPPPFLTSVAFTRDGRKVASVSHAPQASLRFWDLETKAEVVLAGHTNHMSTLAFHPDGQLAATGSSHDGTLRLWDLTTGSPGRSLVFGPGPFGDGLQQVTFSPKGGYVITANYNGTISILKVPALPPPYDPGPPRKLPDPVELAKRPSAADALKRADIPADLLAKAGRGKVDAPPELVAILAHADSQIGAVAISSDGKFLATSGGATKPTVRLFDLANGKTLHTLGSDQYDVYRPAFGPNIGIGEPGAVLLATLQSDRTVRLWNVDTGKEIRTMAGHTATRPKCIAFSADGRWLACGDDTGTILVWDAATGKRLRSFPGAVSDYGQMAFSPDGRFLASPGPDGLIRLWDLASGWQLAALAGHTAPARAVAFSPDGRTLSSSGQTDKIIRLWDLATLQPKHTLEGTRSLAVTLAWRADGRLLASDDSAEGTVCLWDMTTEPPRQRAIRMFPATVGHVIPSQFLHGVAFTPEGRYLATANPDGTVYILKLAESGEVFQVPPPHVELQPKAAWPAHDRAVTNVLFADDGNTLISASKDGFVKFWNAASGKEQSKVAAQEDGVRALARTADGKTLATAGFDGIIRLWDPKGNQLHELPGHKGGTAALLFAVGGEQLLSGGADGKVRFWSIKDGKQMSQFDASKDGITHLSLSRDGKTLATSGNDATVRLWDVDTTMLTLSLRDRTAACFAPAGKCLAVATRWGMIELRDTATGQVRTRLRGHSEAPDGLAFSMDGKRLVSCGKDGRVHVWDAGRGRLLAVLGGHQGRPCCVTLAADGKTVAVGAEDGKLLLWDVAGLGISRQ